MKKLILIISLLFISLLAIHAAVQKQEVCAKNTSNGFNKKLTNYIEKAMGAYSIPGIAIGVVKDGKVVYAKEFGVKNINTEKPVTSDTLFHLASVTKLFTATAVMQLVERGKIELDAPIVKYLPNFKMKDPNYKNITVRQLLSHTSGLGDVTDYEWENPVYDDEALDRYVLSLKGGALIAKPGEKYSYSNIGYEILGDLVAKVSGLSYEKYIQKNILIPLAMASSSQLYNKASKKFLANPHVLIKESKVAVSKVFPYNRMHTPSSTLYSNIHDLSRWAIASLNKGELDGKKILKPSTYDLMWKMGKFGKDTAGLGWHIGEYRGLKIVSHSGMDVGFCSNLILVPEKKIAIIGLSNSDFANISHITIVALDIYLGYNVKPPSAPEQVKVNPKIYDNYVGQYELRDSKILIEVSKKNDKLFYKILLGPGASSIELLPETETRYFRKFRPIIVEFKKNASNKVTGLTLSGFDVKRYFADKLN